MTFPAKVVWQDGEARQNPVTLTLEPTQPNMNAASLVFNANQPLTVAKDKAEAAVTLDVRANAQPGEYAVALRGETTVGAGKKVVAAYAPTFPVTVLPTALVKVTVTPPAALKPGAKAEFTVRVERLNDFAGAVKVSVTLPKGEKAVAIADAVIAAGEDAAKLTVTAAADAKPGVLRDLPVTATGTVHGKFAVATEAKVSVTVAK